MISKVKYQEKRWKQICFSAFWFIIICMIYGMIFGFSAQNGEASGNLSHEISKQCVEIMNKVGGHDWSDMLKAELTENMEHPIRKLAHFAEYALLAFAVYQLVKQWVAVSRRIMLGIFLLMVVSAVGDEIHQYFVPGRWCSPVDVLIDSAGGACGLLLGLIFKLKMNLH